MSDLRKAVEDMLADGIKHGGPGFWRHVSKVRAALDADQPPQQHVMAYRLLSEGEIVQKGDQPLNDDCNSWCELVGWEVGIAYYPSVFVPIRRALATTEGLEE